MSNPWYPWYPGDYLRDTQKLSVEEHGCYFLLLNHYYANGQPLDGDLKRIYQICGTRTAKEKSAAEFVLKTYFELAHGQYRNKRADRELARRAEWRERLSQSGRRGAEAKWKRYAEANGQANGPALACPQPHPHKLSQDSLVAGGVSESLFDTGKVAIARSATQSVARKRAPKNAAAPRPKTRRSFPSDFPLTEELKQYATEHGVPAETEWEKFSDHHKAKGSLMADWAAAWRTWVRRAPEFQSKGNADGHKENRTERLNREVDEQNKRVVALLHAKRNG